MAAVATPSEVTDSILTTAVFFGIGHQRAVADETAAAGATICEGFEQFGGGEDTYVGEYLVPLARRVERDFLLMVAEGVHPVSVFDYDTSETIGYAALAHYRSGASPQDDLDWYIPLFSASYDEDEHAKINDTLRALYSNRAAYEV